MNAANDPIGHGMPIFEREMRPQDCYDWVTREHVTLLALRAFDLAKNSCKPDPGERFIREIGGPTWSSRASFAETLSVVFDCAIKAEAYNLGIGDNEFEQDAHRYLLWKRDDRGEFPQ